MAFAGRDIRWKYDADGAGAGAAVVIAAAQSDGFTITVEGIDATTKDDAGVSQLLNDIGVKSWEGSVSGLMSNDTLLTLVNDAASGTALHVFELEIVGLGTARGSWLISSFSSSGAEGAEAATFECSLQSSGAITWTAV